MLQVNYIRQNPEDVKKRLAIRHFANPELVDILIRTDEEIRTLKTTTETQQATLNKLAKETGILMGKGFKAAAEENKTTVSKLKEELNSSKLNLARLEETFTNQLL